LIASSAIMTGRAAPVSTSTPATYPTEQRCWWCSPERISDPAVISNAGQIGNGFDSDIACDHCLLSAPSPRAIRGGTIIVNHPLSSSSRAWTES
jgi:hypothetical protein